MLRKSGPHPPSLCVSFVLLPDNLTVPNELGRALNEAWAWLVGERLLIQDTNKADGWMCISRKGREFPDIPSYTASALFPENILHPYMVEAVRSKFVRQEYQDAVRRAFLEVEVAVRTKGNYTNDDVGVKLMNKAFNNPGNLKDPQETAGEQEAVRALFAGAMGYIRNPSSHRHVPLTPEVTIEILGFASYLYRIVDGKP